MGVPMRPRGIMATKLRKTTYMRSGTLFSGSGLIPALPEVLFLHLRHSRYGSTSILGSCEGERPQRTPHKQQWLLSFVPKLAANLGRWRTESPNFPSWPPGQSSAHSFAVCRTGPEIAVPGGRATYSKFWPGCRELRIPWDRP